MNTRKFEVSFSVDGLTPTLPMDHSFSRVVQVFFPQLWHCRFLLLPAALDPFPFPIYTLTHDRNNTWHDKPSIIIFTTITPSFIDPTVPSWPDWSTTWRRTREFLSTYSIQSSPLPEFRARRFRCSAVARCVSGYVFCSYSVALCFHFNIVLFSR